MTPRPLTTAGAVLTIDLGAICNNWRALRALVGKATCAAVVKADAYGLGARQVAPALYRAGCRHFFVAHLDEGAALRPALPADATIYVLHGAHPGAEADCAAHGLVPVLNSLPQVAAWQKLGIMQGQALPAVLQIDTGMARLGLAADELDQLAAVPAVLQGIALQFVMSHLASAEEQDNPANRAQRERFRAALARLPKARASLANSSGIFLGGDYHFDLVRPGAALYGVAPVAGRANPLRPAIRLQGKVLQLRTIEAGTPVGYAHTWTAARRSRIATVAVGYADGYLRSLSNRGHALCDGIRLPLVGNVSMDTLTLDVTDLPEGRLGEGTLVDLADPVNDVDAIAARAGTIGYEILTSLGARYARRHIEPAAAPPAQ
ncbi:alanine racemase [Azospira restricta]|uniref:Alanine racemase n=1 Tax=Azospira restricta TaxID=404405 RepID=A0A974PWS0_9RHOO|nr:alanine racemase [Azospira restricta]QRJ62746.1 alanine racemase [Azospira restricta]